MFVGLAAIRPRATCSGSISPVHKLIPNSRTACEARKAADSINPIATGTAFPFPGIAIPENPPVGQFVKTPGLSRAGWSSCKERIGPRRKRGLLKKVK
ncbi:MAG: hypothetical protein ACOVN5_08175 [Aquidulcibacter sp.]|jgi:hypothetical protein